MRSVRRPVNGPERGVPWSERDVDLDATPVEISYRLGDTWQSPGHAREKIELPAVVDPKVGIRVPHQDRINAAVPSLEVVQVFVDGVLACLRVVEEAVVHHHLRLHEGGA